MLFSSSEVAEYINAKFEPAWESVRPAPQVTIDFGDGHVVRRTLQGNVATYVCAPDGTVYDVLPGSYAPAVYLEQLKACRALAVSLRTPPAGSDAKVANPSARLRDYHARRAAALAAAPPPPAQVQAFAQTGGGMKGGFGGFGGGVGGGLSGGFGGNAGGFGGFGGIEGPTQRVITGRPPGPAAAAAPPAGPLATRPELTLDSQANERIRRRLVHERLAKSDPVRPDDIKKWLYKDVLHADLDDPLLGLGRVLNENYPFAEEDRTGSGAGKPAR